MSSASTVGFVSLQSAMTNKARRSSSLAKRLPPNAINSKKYGNSSRPKGQNQRSVNSKPFLGERTVGCLMSTISYLRHSYRNTARIRFSYSRTLLASASRKAIFPEPRNRTMICGAGVFTSWNSS